MKLKIKIKEADIEAEGDVDDLAAELFGLPLDAVQKFEDLTFIIAGIAAAVPEDALVLVVDDTPERSSVIVARQSQRVCELARFEGPGHAEQARRLKGLVQAEIDSLVAG